MKRVLVYKVANNGDLLFVKRDVGNFLKDKIANELLNLYLFGIMELGSNLIKHAKKGEIWILENEGVYFIVFLDKGGGIENINWAMQKGTTTYKNSLGLGLYQLSQNELLDLKIFTSTELKGTVILLKPKNYNPKEVFFVLNFMDIEYSGDFVIKKGKFYILGDVSGHGLKAYKTAESIKRFFFKSPFSCILANEFFKKLHSFLIESKLRSVVLSVLEVNKKSVLVCGVGNIGVMEKNNSTMNFYELKSGILGESFSGIKEKKFVLDKGLIVGVFSDGVNKSILNKLQNVEDIVLFSVCALYFSDVNDDKSILLIKGE
jgi:anti-sigma regulatory factor (Ser/Thr protein kinase)